MDLFSQIENPEREEILALRKELEQANYQYYVLNAPTLSDYDFDQKLRRLQDLEAQYPDMFDPNSPTQHVGSDLIEAKGERREARGEGFRPSGTQVSDVVALEHLLTRRSSRLAQQTASERGDCMRIKV